jgi:1-acyl-sn-glycerol-3-phosphate acyltransferase
MTRALGRLILRVFGWRIVGTLPTARKYVLCAAPHTSNWDFVFTVATYWAVGVKLHWVGKASLFKGPFGPIMRGFGGIAVDRSHAQGMVQSLAEAFRRAEHLVVAVPTEGSRSRREYWKSGFYHIARSAGVPVVLGSLDFPKREATLGPTVEPVDDVRVFMDSLRAFYADKVGRYPEYFGPVRIKEEDAASTVVPPAGSG